MSLADITITQLRCIASAELRVGPSLTLIWGDNGSGKTSLLEGIYLLGRGRSFRSSNNKTLIAAGQDHLRVSGLIEANSLSQSLVVRVSLADGVQARVGGGPADSLSELARIFPVQVIEPGIHRLIEEGGHRRRRWIDWATFHVEPRFLDTWSRYGRALRQRNAALRESPQEAASWDAQLTSLGESLSLAREAFLERLQPYWKETVRTLAELPVELRFRRGWPQGESLAAALETNRSRDRLRGQTHAGPHRGDVAVLVDGRPAREILSRGQQKLVAIAMTVAQLRLLREVSGLAPTLLLDDPGAELDAGRLQCFIAYVKELRCQLIATSLTAESRLFGTPERTFRVVQGRVQPL
ncbi:MAG: DNA replication/repair protein RecF [Proteobacteria bacterium]|nr:DNA replication/repair protein RecF [Pseudomonadota bacterium]